MADLNTDAQQKTADDAGQKPADGVQDTKTQETAEITFTAAQQAHLDRVIEDRLARQRTQFDKKQKDAADAAEQKRLVEQGEFKALADQRQMRILELEADLKSREVNTLKATVATRHKLPEHWIGRLVGETEAELDADAARIAKDLAPPKAPNAEGGERPSGTSKADARARALQELKSTGRYAA
jgi:hypothetical protein